MPVKILRIVYDWPPPWSGLAPAPYEMSAAQVKLGHEVSVFCGRWPFAGAIEAPPGVKVKSFIREPLAGTLNLTTSVVMFLSYLLWRRKNDVDIIHSHGHFAIWIYWYRSFLQKKRPKAKELQTPMVVRFHNTVKGRWEKMKAEKKPIKWMSENVSWPLALKSDQWAVQVADICIFVSEDIRQDAIKYYGADPNKCYVIESAVNTELFKPVVFEEILKTRGEMGIKSEHKVMLNYGVMVERKNIHVLIQSLIHLPQKYVLLLVGPAATGDYKTKLDTIISKYDLSDRIIRIGYTPYPQIPIAIQASNLLVLPSDWEGFPKVVMESLACGVPALASGFKAQNEIEGLVYLKDVTPEGLAKQVQEVMESDVKVDLNTIRGHYSWNIMARKIDQIYAKVMGR
jgi:glycosyltransferase involved in cell wall biosynthesis